MKCKYHPEEYLDPDVESVKRFEGKGYCKKCDVFWSLDQPERSKREDCYIGGYFPPPWNPNEHPEKTEGWIAFQEEQRKNPKYYGCGALNSMET